MLNIILNHDKPLYQQIYSQIRRDILLGNLTANTKLPSSRNLSNFLSVSRNTVDLAYEQLQAEGYIDSKPRRGFFVNHLTHIKTFTSKQVIDDETENEKKTYRFDLLPDNVDLTHFPFSVWKRLSQNIVSDGNLFRMGDNKGDYAFRQQINNYLHGSRNVNCKPSQIVIGAGVDYLLQLITAMFSPNHVIAMENPAYMRAKSIFRSKGYTVQDINVTENGMDLDALKASSADICYVTPSHQYPLGTVMPISARQTLLQWAREKENRYIIEDDHDSEYRYKGKPIPSLQGIDHSDKTIYIGTFSKALAPSIRVAYMVLPNSLMPVFEEKCGFYACTVSRIDQGILTHFIEDGYFERHLNRMRKIYRDKHDYVLNFLKEYEDTIEVSGASTGLYMILTYKKSPACNNTSVANRTMEEIFIERASKHQVRIIGLANYYNDLPKDYLPSLLFGYGNLELPELKKALTILMTQVLF